MSTIEWIRNLLQRCPALENAAGVAVDELKEEIDFFSIDPLPGGGIVEEDLDGTKTVEFPFTVSSYQCSADEASRLDSNGTFENLRQWLEDITSKEELPDMSGNRYADSIEATSWGYLFQREDDPSTAVYQISGKLTYVAAEKESDENYG
jgi:hypothetical protein